MVELKFLGKTFTPKGGVPTGSFSVFEHSVLVGATAIALLRHHREYDIVGMPYFFSLHDVGKISPGFQALLSSAINSCGRSTFPTTESVSFKELCDDGSIYCRHHEEITNFHFTKSDSPESSLHFSESIRSILRLHHGGVRGTGTYSPSMVGSDEDNIKWVSERNQLIQHLSEVFGSDLPDKKFLKKHKMMLASLLVIADWIGSDEEVFTPDQIREDYPFRSNGEFKLDDLVERADQALRRYGLIQDRALQKNLSFNEVFPFMPNPVQQLLIEQVTGPGVYLLEAPMGEGKTEASLYIGYKGLSEYNLKGMYFALPTQVTSNKIHDRVELFLDAIGVDQAPMLIHGKSKVIYQSHPSRGSSWFRNNKRSILAPFGVGTIDQALLGVLPGVKHWFLRQFGLDGKVTILDEVHSYDAYTGSLMNTMIKNAYENGGIVILLSATLTTGAKAKLFGCDESKVASPDYPLVTSMVAGDILQTALPNQRQIKKNKRYKIIESSYAEQLIQAVQRVKAGMKVLWFENTVARAQEVFDYCAPKLGEDQAGLLHSRFTVEDRGRLEEKWISRFSKGSARKGFLLVSTQVAEQSLDLDADCMYTELCPCDMLLQRLGRVWRHEIEEQRPLEAPEVYIHHLDITALAEKIEGEGELNKMSMARHAANYGSSLYVYHPYILSKSFKALQDLGGELDLPKDIRPLLETTYQSTHDYPVLRASFERIAKDEAALADATMGGGAMGQLKDPEDKPPMTRNITDDTMEVIICDGYAGDKVLIGQEWRELNQSSNIPLFEMNMIKVHPKRVEEVLITKKIGKVCFFILVKNKSGNLLNVFTQQSSASNYCETRGLVYAKR